MPKLLSSPLLIFSIAIVILLAGGSLLLRAGRDPNADTVRLEKITIAIPALQTSALVIFAKEAGFFRAQMLDVDVVYLPTGLDALQFIYKNRADLAVAYETPIVRALLNGYNLSVITEMHRSDLNTQVIARRDHGVLTPNDLRGKTIAVVAQTNSDFHLDLLLHSNLIETRDVRIQYESLRNLIDDLSQGAVDAAGLWEPYINEVIKRDPKNYILMHSPFYTEFSMLTGLREKIDAQSARIYRVTRALVDAANAFHAEPEKAMAIVDAKLNQQGFPVSPLAWRQLSVGVGLSSTLLTIIREETKLYASRDPAARSVDLKSVLRGRYLSLVSPRSVTYE